jgi:hypothetical protein
MPSLTSSRIKETLDQIVTAFESPETDIPAVVAMGLFPSANIPCNKWSTTNKIITWFAGTNDARGFRQWKKVNRYVKKGSKSFTILAPRLAKREDAEGNEQSFLAGFLAVPVFRVEDTDGAPLEYPEIELPELPLLDRARAWNLKVDAVAGDTLGNALGSLRGGQHIRLATSSEHVFFHELAHASDYRIKPLVGGQEPLQEIAAEMAAEALSRLVGKRLEDTTGTSYKYVKYYAKKVSLSPSAACLKVIGRVEQILGLILEPIEPKAKAA